MIGRRQLILSGVVAAASACAGSSKHLVTPNKPVLRGTVPPTALAQARVAAAPVAPGPEPRIVQEALAALDRHDRMVVHRDRIAIVDFSVPSSKPRMQVLNVGSGKMTQFLVAHGSGSDPDHTGYLQRFSNIPDSNASSQGAFVTADYYVGKHGRSQRLLGLDPTNNNALERAIVVHGAWYANADMIPVHGKLGRSQGCFAVGETELATLFDQLGPGRMIYSAKA
jgi:hypothetical protein